ncbi:MAG: noncanonical pyrimidine nucleotidase, YjjG family [Ardenticatenales bacterium]|nr:noncanonical pyrimidine nucleotidase, YjjG family [Ardenticatenales bacterium]
MTQRYEWLLFDADGTLFDYDRSEGIALQRALTDVGLPFESPHLPLYREINLQLWQALERGEVTPARLRVQRFERLLAAIAPEAALETVTLLSIAYVNHLAGCAELIDGAEAVLDALAEHYRFAILTNGLHIVQHSRLACSTIRHHIAHLVTSEEVGYAKPRREFFEAALARLGSPAKSAVLMIGDSLTSDMQGGVDYGIDTCWYNPTAQIRPARLPLTYEIAALAELVELLDHV